MKTIIMEILAALAVCSLILFGLNCLINKLPQNGKIYHAVKLQSGEEISCAESSINPCGINLSECTNGKTYKCQTNVEL